jgi:uncharacterized protein YjbI with pentapeptide repeats
MSGADLREADLSGASLRKANLSNAVLSEANLSEGSEYPFQRTSENSVNAKFAEFTFHALE